MKKNFKVSMLVTAFMIGLPNIHAAGVAKYQGKDLVTPKDVDAKIQEQKLTSMPREQVFMHFLVQLAEERLIKQRIQESKMESDADFQKAAKLNAEEFKRSYYLQKEAQKRITQPMRQAVYDQIKASVKGKKEINPKIIVLTDEITANNVYTRLQKGEKFEELAKAHSIDPSKENGGLVGRFLPEEAFAPEVIAELPKLKECVASKPIKASSPSGNVYIIFLIEKGQRRDYQLPVIDAPEMAAQIEQIILRQMMGVVQADLLRQLEVYDLKGNKVPLVPEQEAQAGIPLIGGGTKK
jgi:parvulin-like peptidyl-prolyl isomerase